jgi:glycosyltransferase involved in cell wall biosynthesis
LGIPAVVSPVGVNKEIINDGNNGFLASSKPQWSAKLEKLIENEGLRKEMGQKGRKTVVEHYSVRAWQGRFVALLDQAKRNVPNR